MILAAMAASGAVIAAVLVAAARMLAAPAGPARYSDQSEDLTESGDSTHAS